MTELIRQHRFFAHPFASWTAEKETDSELGDWFVPPPFMDALLGRLGAQTGDWEVRSHVVFGRPGDGKTAIRNRLESELLEKRPRAMLIRYVDFASPLSRSTSPALADHVDELLRLATAALLMRLHQDPTTVERLDARQRGELLWLCKTNWSDLPQEAKDVYASTLNPLTPKVFSVAKHAGRAAVDAYNAVVSVLNKQPIQPIDWQDEKLPTGRPGSPVQRLHRLWRIAAAMGSESIWVVVDRVDEAPGCQQPEAIFACLSSLLMAQNLLELSVGSEQVMCFKIFLTKPDALKPLLDKAGFRKDRVKLDIITWRSDELSQALGRRLAHFSSRHIVHFDELCVNSARGTHERLALEAAGRPRTLFRIAHEILEAFDRRAPADTFKLDDISIAEGIAEGKSAEYD